VAGQKLPDLHAQVLYARVIPTLVDASKVCQMIVVGSRGPGELLPYFLDSVGLCSSTTLVAL
jgi:hypothetical protein